MKIITATCGNDNYVSSRIYRGSPHSLFRLSLRASALDPRFDTFKTSIARSRSPSQFQFRVELPFKNINASSVSFSCISFENVTSSHYESYRFMYMQYSELIDFSYLFFLFRKSARTRVNRPLCTWNANPTNEIAKSKSNSSPDYSSFSHTQLREPFEVDESRRRREIRRGAKVPR